MDVVVVFAGIGFAVVGLLAAVIVVSLISQFWEWFVYERMCPRCKAQLQNEANKRLANLLRTGGGEG